MQNLISIRQDEYKRLYLGKWLRIEGQIKNITADGEKISVSMWKDDAVRGLYLKFENVDMCSYLRTLDKGCMLACVGKIFEIENSYVLRMEHCEIVPITGATTEL